MRTADLIRYSLRSLWRGRGRTLLAAMAVAIGVFSIIVISAAGDGGKQMILREVERLGLRGLTIFTSDASGQDLQKEDVALAGTVDGVACAMPVLLEYTTFSVREFTGGSLLWGVTEELPQIMDLELREGRFFTLGDVAGRERNVIIDDTMAQSTFGLRSAIGKAITIEFPAGKEQFTVIGVVSSQKAGLDHLMNGTLPQFFYLPYDTLAELTGRGEFDQLAISCMSGKEPEKVGKSVALRLNRAAGLENAYQYENISAYRQGLEEITELVALLISAIAAISLLVAGLCIMNSMLSAASERKQEIGICMAIGAEQRDIMRCFLVESAIVSALGGLIGAAAAAGCILLAGSLFQISLTFPWNAVLTAECVSIGFGILFGLLPAQKAAHLDPIYALRSE